MPTLGHTATYSTDDSVEEDHFGTKVADPYRWLEDPDCEETQKFVKGQNEVFDGFMTEDKRVRDKFHARMKECFNFARFSTKKTNF